MQLPAPLLALLLVASSSPTAAESLPSLNASLLWGPYRPNLYLGIRARVPDSLIAGLMWGEVNDIEKKLRHAVNQSDGITTYDWRAYDARAGGIQTIEDPGNNIDITTEFIKKYEGQSAGNWGLRIKGTPRKDGLRTSVIFYMGMEGMKSCTSCVLEAREQMGIGDDPSVHAVNMELKHPKLGTAGIHIPASVGNSGRQGMVVKTLNVAEDKLWQANFVFLDTLKQQTVNRKGTGSIDLVLHNEPGAGNMHFVQMICDGNFEFDVLYSSRAATRSMTPNELTRELRSTVESFKKSLSLVFGPKAPFNTDQHRTFSETVLSNLFGSLAYLHGTAQVDTSKKAIHAETTGKFWDKSNEAKKHATPETRGPHELLTHTSSRAVSPRGSLWDEGLHLLTVLDWDADLAIEVVRSWLALIDEDGWIAREQIFSNSVRSGTRDESTTQYPHIATPPTMFLVLSKYIDMVEGEMQYNGHASTYVTQRNVSTTFIAQAYPLLKKHYAWFRKSQAGDVEAHSVPAANLNEGYRWRGRTPDTNLASGMYDYPRAEPPDVSELHVDALCWVGVMSRTLEKMAHLTSNPSDALAYQAHTRGIQTNLEVLHWSSSETTYCDALVRDETHSLVCHKGYLSLLPLITGLLSPTHPHLPAVLDLITHLWTPHGLRSLSPYSAKYGPGTGNWRSPIHITTHYLLLTRLHSLATTPGPSQARCRDIYTALRRNIVRTAFTAWQETGSTWEMYDPVTGKGVGARCVSGAVGSVMGMPDLAPGGMGEGVKSVYKGVGGEWGGVVVFGGCVVFGWVNRRRFAGTWRGVRRRGRRRGRGEA
ncbi:glycoside hydrolase family 63 protein [Dothidotthia symphoricarpi CBS 119687]|uniref:Mannosyl-oligosaccharide glucosidase n=1 Tax=Dothidotthia symphoricarpi CBS 119687 TaxID=1392245 RepID=A0A6A6A921_9PLEO|nr:glycoside hydrolase family 63 protein [Dothidotthia symphoricarpi CBS 119687]KAF2127328.1 glycoside hydrolase family 63 protein [Dothidotthia symphoricarpi CBS 119687]